MIGSGEGHPGREGEAVDKLDIRSKLRDTLDIRSKPRDTLMYSGVYSGVGHKGRDREVVNSGEEQDKEKLDIRSKARDTLMYSGVGREGQDGEVVDVKSRIKNSRSIESNKKRKQKLAAAEKRVSEDLVQRSQMEKWVCRKETITKTKRDNETSRVAKIAEIFGSTEKSKADKEREQKAAEKKMKEKIERSRHVTEKRRMFEIEGEGAERRETCEIYETRLQIREKPLQ